MQNEAHHTEAYAHFVRCFRTATQNIQDSYMVLPIAGHALPIYRERVYCYELYHQLRLSWRDHAGYSLGGEVDKTHHPLMQGPGIDRVKPDLLVHRPGDMGGNLIIIEVKPVTAEKSGIEKDLKTLTAFLHRGQYHYAIYLAYGAGSRALNLFRKKARSLQEKTREDRISLNAISLYWHRIPGYPAEQIEWNGSSYETR